MTARTTQVRSKKTGKVCWMEHRIGFGGREFNFGGGWRRTMDAAYVAAEKSNALNEVKAGSTP